MVVSFVGILFLYSHCELTTRGTISRQHRKSRRGEAVLCESIVLREEAQARKCKIGSLMAPQKPLNRTFTLVMNTFGPYARRSRESLEELSWHYCSLPETGEIVISWNPPHRGFELLLKLIRKKCSIPVTAILYEKNSLSNKFRLTASELSNNLVLHVDNDIFISHKVLQSSFQLFQAKFSTKLMGFFCAALVADAKSGSIKYQSYPPKFYSLPKKCDFVLTGMAFLDHTLYHARYFDTEFEPFRKLVSKYMSGEDLLMNAVVATTQSLAPHAVHYGPHECLKTKDIQFNSMYGHEERFGKPLWDQRMMELGGRYLSKRLFMSRQIIEKFGHLMAPIPNVCSQEGVPEMHILIPFGVGDPIVLTKAIDSAQDQKYPRKKIWLVPDGIAPKNVDFITTLCQRFTCVETDYKEHHGPAYTKFAGLKAIQKAAQSRDVVVILDGDDAFLGSNALDIIWNHYKNRDCWFTYGSMRGMYSEQIVQYKQSGTVLRPRSMDWVWGHPRSMLVDLLKYVSKEDFQDDEGSWAMKGSERGLVYKIVELSGFNHTCYIQDEIYDYITPAGGPKSLGDVTREKKMKILKHFASMVPSDPLENI